MDVNGENMVKKWLRGIYVFVFIIVVLWLLDVLFVNRLVIYYNYIVILYKIMYILYKIMFNLIKVLIY